MVENRGTTRGNSPNNGCVNSYQGDQKNAKIFNYTQEVEFILSQFGSTF